MTADTNMNGLRDQGVGTIAARLPGASAVFRRFGIDFCCQGHVTLGDAAAHRGLDLGALEAALGALDPAAVPEAPRETGALIAHIRTRYHDTHRSQLAELTALSEKVETAHLHHPRVPLGLGQVLRHFWTELETLMTAQEETLFPALAAPPPSGPPPGTKQAIRAMRHDHGQFGFFVDRIDRLTEDCTAPEDACATWRALATGLARFRADLIEHLHLENNVLFPRFEAAHA